MSNQRKDEIPYIESHTMVGKLEWADTLRTTSGGTPVWSFGLYIRHDLKPGPDGERRWLHNRYKVVVWGKMAEACAKYLEKNQEVVVQSNRSIIAEGWVKKGTMPPDVDTKSVVTADIVKFGHRQYVQTEDAPPEFEEELPF